MEPDQLAKQYLKQIKIMQLATAEDNKPWVCTVHFYADDDFNLYWASRTDRNHSRHVTKNPQASATIMVHENTPEEDYVAAVTVAGIAEKVDDMPDDIRRAYIEKLDRPDNLLPPNNMQAFYRLKAERIVLLDTKNFPQNPSQEWKP